MTYVHKEMAGCTELRIHGCSGASPEDLLECAHAEQVAGDELAGFYRRKWERKPPLLVPEYDGDRGDNGRHRLEAYSWGPLTSGGWSRALWLLLVPFTFLNVAYFMAPRTPPLSTDNEQKEPWRWRIVQRLSELVQRLLGLVLTLTFVVGAVWIAMDLVGWRIGREMAGAEPARFGFLRWNWLNEPGRHLALTALVPTALIVLLWALAHRTWQRTERADVPFAEAHEATWVSPLEDRSMWNGEEPAARLRALHVAAAFTIVGVLLTAPFLYVTGDEPMAVRTSADWSHAWGWLHAGLTSAFLVILLVCVGLMMFGRHRRPRPADTRAGSERSERGEMQAEKAAKALKRSHGMNRLLVWCPFVFLLAAGGMASATNGPGRLPAGVGHDQLPWLAGTTAILAAAQLVLVLALALLCAAQAWSTWTQDADERHECVDRPGRALSGMAQVVVSAMACLMADWLILAFVIRGADWLGAPVADGTKDGHQVLPVQFFWMAAAALVTILATAVIAAGLLLTARVQRRKYRGMVYRRYHRDRSPDADVRADAIAKAWSSASLTDVVIARLPWIVLFYLVLLLFVAGGYVAAPNWLLIEPGSVVFTIGNLAMIGIVLLAFWVGKQTYSQPKFRRTVGVLWDLGTFWPRATHPLAPPCYSERTIPDLLKRMEAIQGQGGEIILCGHSQGGVIAAATVFQARTSCIDRTSLLTYGSPLRRLYARFFPAYFGSLQLERLGRLLSTEAQPQVWRWINLHRDSDPIGGAVFVDHVNKARPDPAEVIEIANLDWHLLDPAFDRALGDTCDPAPLGHSDYERDDAFHEAIRRLHGHRGTRWQPGARRTRSTTPGR